MHSSRDLNFQNFANFRETFSNFSEILSEKLLSVDYIWAVLQEELGGGSALCEKGDEVHKVRLPSVERCQRKHLPQALE